MSTSFIKVEITWARLDGFLICASDMFGRPYPARDLAFLLFAFDERSYFGTTIEPVTKNTREYIQLTPLEAMYYFSDPGVNNMAAIEWPTDWPLLQAAAEQIRHALETGSFTLDGHQGAFGELVWSLEPDAMTAYESLSCFSDWVNFAIWGLIESTPELQSAFSAVEGAHPALTGTDVPFSFADADEWKIAIGLMEDNMPFTVGLQLVDPYTAEAIDSLEAAESTQAIESPDSDDLIGSDLHTTAIEADEDEWHLNVVLQDKSDSSRLVTYSPQTVLPDDWEPYVERISRKIEQCAEILPWLAEGNDNLKSILDSDEALLFLEEGSVRIAETGIPVFLPEWWEEIRRAAVTMKANVKSSSNTGSASGVGRKSMFGLAQTVNFDWRVAIGDVEMTEEEFLQLVAQKRKLVRFRGRFIRVDSDEFRAIAARMNKIQNGKSLTLRDVFEIHLLGGVNAGLTGSGTAPGAQAQTGQLESGALDTDAESDYHRVMMEVELDGNLAKLMQRLAHTGEIPNIQVPETFQGKLRPYQQVGVSWLTFLRTYGLGACLADDMGLGKTVQYIVYLLAAREGESEATQSGRGLQAQADPQSAPESQPTAPSLLICPTSVIGNWQKELERFSPTLNVYVHYGAKRGHNEEFVQRSENANIILTSYTLAQMDEDDFTQVAFDSICLDEAQNIKNPHTKQAQAIRKFRAMHRVAMTGTPIENRLTELWSIFDFINPGYLGTLHSFQEKFVTPIERHQDGVKLEQVKRLVHPLLLRRVKQDPAIQLDLPEKVESKVYVSLTPEQAALYENVVTDMLGKLDKLTGIERAGIILTTLLKLKQICNHPRNFLKDKSAATDGERSNKLTRLIEMVSEAIDEDDSCLVFTQFVEMGQILKEELEKAFDQKVLFLHGGLNKAQRDNMINVFQNGKARIFILSLKAGGVGLNLTAASHVFHFDRWWNPAVENQATDRAFRIGQTKQVDVHKFVTLGTLEEKIDEMIEQKQALSNQIVGGGESWITQMSTNELRDLFVLRREWVDMDT